MRVARGSSFAWPAILGGVVFLSCVSPTGSCGCSPVENPIAGTWVATEFGVTPTGQQPVDVLAAGGSLTITIAYNYATSGSLTAPAGVIGVAPASMAGTAALNSTHTEVTFTQAADTFVRNVTWQRVGNTSLRVSNQITGSASFTVTLTRQ